MHPVLLHWGGFELRSYSVCVALAFMLGLGVRRLEARRLPAMPANIQRWLNVCALLGAVVGAKVGMLLFQPVEAFGELLAAAGSLDFTGKTVVGGLAGGILGVELCQRALGVGQRTGDAFALGLPLAQAIGRVGCLLNGCCYGTPSELPWAIELAGVRRHPAQLYEALLDLAMAGVILLLRTRPMPTGHLWRVYLVGYAAIRFVVDFGRGDPSVHLGPLTAVQVVCLFAIAVFGAQLRCWRRDTGPRLV